MDIDHFKQVNDVFGHRSGDRVLIALSNMLLANTRRKDFPCRYGGEEFLVVLPDTPLEAALRRAEAWRANLAGMIIHCGETEVRVTVSVGVAEYPTHGTTPDEVLSMADAALYKAKRDGRNRVQDAGRPGG